jgi:hypothetical protein
MTQTGDKGSRRLHASTGVPMPGALNEVDLVPGEITM